MKEKLDKFIYGLILGTFLPPLSLYAVLKWFKLKDLSSMKLFLTQLSSFGGDVTIFLWCLLPVGFIFALFYFLHYDQAGKGIVFPVMIYTIVIIILDMV